MKKLTAEEQIERMRNRRRIKKVSRGLRATLEQLAEMKEPQIDNSPKGKIYNALKIKAFAFAKILLELKELVKS